MTCSDRGFLSGDHHLVSFWPLMSSCHEPHPTATFDLATTSAYLPVGCCCSGEVKSGGKGWFVGWVGRGFAAQYAGFGFDKGSNKTHVGSVYLVGGFATTLHICFFPGFGRNTRSEVFLN